MSAVAVGAAVLTVGVLPSCADATVRPEAISGTDQRPLPGRVFADTSFWYKPLAANAPLDSRSAAIVARATKAAADKQYPKWSRGRPDMAINTTVYTPPIYVANKTDPLVTFAWNNCQGKANDMGLIRDNLTKIRVPKDARPSEGSDGELVIYDVDSGTYTDTWQTRFDGKTWSACWGGSIRNARQSNGIFPSYYGTTASGLPLEPGTIKVRELAAGRIDHVIGIVMPHSMMSADFTSPAKRTDGSSKDVDAIKEGQMMRLPANLDLNSLHLNPVAKTIAEAAKKYGFIVWDGGGSISFRAENAQAFKSDPYAKIFNGVHPALAMWGDPSRGEQPFPFEKLQVLNGPKAG